MRGALHLALRHALHHRAQSAVMTLCIAVTLWLPLATRALIADYGAALVARADATPLVAGPRGNRFDLTLAALYFRESALPPIPYGQVAALSAGDDALAIPLSVRFSARGRPLVATSPDYYLARGLRAAAGTPPLLVGDALLGARVARELGLSVGDALFSDPRELYDISKPASARLRVVGVLQPSGGPDDEAVFVDTKTAWMLEGLAHGHADVALEVDEALVLGRTEQGIVLSGAFIEDDEITDENAPRFHVHGDADALPLSAVLVWPATDKARTILKARLGESRTLQMVAPREVVDDLLGFVFRIRAFLDGYAGALAATTALLTALVVLLSLRLRAREMETLERIGCSRGTRAMVVGAELVAVLAASAVLALAGTVAARALAPQLYRAL